jgi:hypothetical protein
MPIYRLEPIEDFVREQSWRHTLLSIPCWLEAADEDHARRRVALATAAFPADPDSVRQSPWLSPVLTMCIEETPQFPLEPSITVRVDGISQSWVPAES